jgi:hypothetical protein
MLLERAKGSQTITNETFIENISKKLASQEASKTIITIRSNKTHRELPSKAFCRNYFDNFPSTYISRNLYKNKKVTFGNSNEGNFDTNNDESPTTEKKAVVRQLANKLNSINSALVNESYQKAFDILHTVQTPPDDLSSPTTNNNNIDDDDLDLELDALYAKQHELIGTDLYLRCKLDNAANSFKKAIQLSPATSFETKLKLASIYLEIGQIAEVF